MANQLPVPSPLEIHDTPAAEKWTRFKRTGTSYALATGLGDKTEAVQVATLLTVIGEEAWEVFATFAWDSEEDASKIDKVLTIYTLKAIFSIAACKSQGNHMIMLVKKFSE